MNWDALCVVFALGCWGFLAIWMVWFFSQLHIVHDKDIDAIKDHQHWQDDEWQRLMFRCADNEKKIAELEKQLKDLTSTTVTLTEDIAELQNDR